MTIDDIKVVFISGPFRGDNGWEVEKNIRRAEELSFEVWKLAERGAKVAVICSHTNTRYFDGTMDDQVWIDGTQALLLKSDAMLLVPGYENSEGTLGEIEFCKERGIPYFKTVSELENWLVWCAWNGEGAEPIAVDVGEIPKAPALDDLDDLSETVLEDEIKKSLNNLVTILETRASQLFDKIQENPGSAKLDYILVKYFELLNQAIGKIEKITRKK